MDHSAFTKIAAENYPGFPPFVHHIMGMYEAGMDPPTMIEKMKEHEIEKNISRIIDDVNKTHISYNNLTCISEQCDGVPTGNQDISEHE